MRLLIVSIKQKVLIFDLLYVVIVTNRVRHQTSSNSHTPAEEERKTNTATITNKDGLQSVEHAEVHATVDEDTNGRDGESSVQALDTVRLQGLHIDINETIELALTSLALGIISQPLISRNKVFFLQSEVQYLVLA